VIPWPMASSPENSSQTPEQMAARALNEQGFLFSQRIRELIQFGNEGTQLQTGWAYEEKEYPVTGADGSQTRIDIVLRNKKRKGVHVCLECKRAHPDYKRWLFFDKDYGVAGNHQAPLFLETFTVSERPVKETTHRSHRIRECNGSTKCPVFNYYLEVAVDRQGRAGYTQTIEDAFQQVMRGHTGLMKKMMVLFDTDNEFCSVPVVVTTAQLFYVNFDTSKVVLASGMIEAADLKLEPLDFCAVTYHPNDELALSEYVNVTGGRTSIQADITHWLKRTVFVVQSVNLMTFLNWLEAHVFGL
jgi:hypothetical protein